MSTQINIVASCVIGHNSIIKNGVKLYEKSAANMQAFLMQAYADFDINYPKFYKMDGLSKLGWFASEILLKDVDKGGIAPEDVALVLLNANASLDTDIKYYDTVADIASPSLFVYTLPNIMMGEISIRNNFKGENAFFIFEEFDAAFVEKYVTNLLETGKAKYCICGWVDVLDEQYKAALFLINIAGNGNLFTAGNLQKIFNGGNV